MTGSPRRPQYGYTTMLCLVVASMVGAGVFTTSGYTLATMGSPGQVILAWGIGGLLALAGAASYGQLIRWLPQSGGEYLFLSRAAHPVVGFLAGWISLVAGFSGAAAMAALAMESYLLQEPHRLGGLPPGSLAVCLIVIASILHGVRVQVGSRVQNVVVVLKLLMILGLCAVAVAQCRSHVWHTDPIEQAPRNWLNYFAALGSSLVWISFSYSGFNAAVYVAGEVDRPTETVSRAMWHATLLVTVVYLALNTIFVLAAPGEDLAGKTEVAAIAARALGGPILDQFVRVTIIVAQGTSVMSLMMAGPRVYAQMAADGLMPRWISRDENGPRAAIALQAGLAIALILFFNVQELLNYLGLTLSLSAAGTVSCLFLPKLRARNRAMHPGAGWWIAPALFVTGTLTNGFFLTMADSRQLVGTALTVIVGILVYLLSKKGVRNLRSTDGGTISRTP